MLNTLYQPPVFTSFVGGETFKVQTSAGELTIPASALFDAIADRVDARAAEKATQAASGVAGTVTASATAAALAALPAVPQPASAMPPGVADDGSIGDDTRYARANHTHASKARKQIAVMPSASTTYKWTYPTPFAVGVVPVVTGIVQVPAGTGDLFNVQIVGQPTRTDCTFQINRVSSGLLSLLTGALSINPQPIAATLHLIALEP